MIGPQGLGVSPIRLLFFGVMPMAGTPDTIMTIYDLTACIKDGIEAHARLQLTEGEPKGKG